MSSRPHVLVDAVAIPRNRAGVGRYLAHLLPALDRRGERLTILAQQHDADWLRAACPGATVVPVGRSLTRRPVRLAWEQTGLPALARRVQADVLFSPHYTLPLLTGRPVVVTLHDATFFSMPEVHTPVKRRFFRWWIRRAARRAALLVVPSASARDELVARAGAPADRIRVAPHGVDTAVFHVPSAAERDAAAARVGAERWIAFLGTLEPRKNLSSLVRAFASLVADGTAGDLVLALAGGRGWDEELDAVIQGSGVAERIRVTGYLPDEELAGFLGGAEVVAYPSLGEGFGLPVAEALASGSVVLTTPRLSLPEVGGDAAVYSEPDAGSLAAALRDLLGDDARRAELRRRGPERAATFDWDESARIHAEAFADAAGATR